MVLSPAQKSAVRKEIVNFCQRAEDNRLNWHYVEVRPFHGYGLVPEAVHPDDDCSAYVSLVFNWAMHKTKIYLADPLNFHYTGIGNTDTQYNFLKNHPAPEGKYLVGDMAIFGTRWHTIHTAICRKAGGDNAILSSNGRGSTIFGHDAPEPVTVGIARAAQPLVGIFRHPALL